MELKRHVDVYSEYVGADYLIHRMGAECKAMKCRTSIANAGKGWPAPVATPHL
jgi:hypothetical protein